MLALHTGIDWDAVSGVHGLLVLGIDWGGIAVRVWAYNGTILGVHGFRAVHAVQRIGVNNNIVRIGPQIM